MIKELMDCGPSRTYPVYYLEDAMNNLGDCFDYAVNDYGAEGSEVAELFCLSGVTRTVARSVSAVLRNSMLRSRSQWLPVSCRATH